MQNVTLTRTLRRVDEEGKAIFDYMVYGVKDNGDVVETVLKHENTAILKELNSLVETFITKEDELEILKKTVEFMSVSKSKEVDTDNAQLDLPPNQELPPTITEITNDVNLKDLEKEILSKIEDNKEVE